MYKILLVCAMREEFQALIDILEEQKISYVVEYRKIIDRQVYQFNYGEFFVQATWLGITYFNSARLASLISLEPFNLVVNFGTTAGLKGQEIGSVVMTDRFRSSDLMATGFGYLDGSLLKEDTETCIHEDIQVSGSQFLASKDDVKAVLRRFPSAVAFDMESFSWYSACTVLGVKFLSIRGVSDNGDESENGSFAENLPYATKQSIKATLLLLRSDNIKLYIKS